MADPSACSGHRAGQGVRDVPQDGVHDLAGVLARIRRQPRDLGHRVRLGEEASCVSAAIPPSPQSERNSARVAHGM
jgi:hypothetical protein